VGGGGSVGVDVEGASVGSPEGATDGSNTGSSGGSVSGGSGKGAAGKASTVGVGVSLGASKFKENC
jgi:hypothetical protein